MVADSTMFSVGAEGLSGWMVKDVGVPLEGVTTVIVPFATTGGCGACATGLADATAAPVTTLPRETAATATNLSTRLLRIMFTPHLLGTALVRTNSP